MDKSNVVSIQTQASAVTEGKLNLEQLLRQGAQRMLMEAIENEVEEFVQAHASLRTGDDRQAVVRNGSLPARQIVTGLGLLDVQQPRVRDRRSGEKVRFTSNILPKYLRRVPSVDALIPALYLGGSPRGTSPRLWSRSWAPTPVGCRPPTSSGSKKAGKESMKNGTAGT